MRKDLKEQVVARVNRTNTKELLTVPIAFIDHFDLVFLKLDHYWGTL